MQIPFTAFAEDCTVSGQVDLRADRLSDLLSSTEEFPVDDATFRSLDDGHVVEAGSVDICRDDLCVVLASGPQGIAERRVWTRQHPVRARVGPYVVIGYLHAPPTIDPLRTTDRRPIVALTGSVIGYTEAGQPVWVESGAVLVNTVKIELLEAATEEDVGLARRVEQPVALETLAPDVSPAN